MDTGQVGSGNGEPSDTGKARREQGLPVMTCSGGFLMRATDTHANQVLKRAEEVVRIRSCSQDPWLRAGPSQCS